MFIQAPTGESESHVPVLAPFPGHTLVPTAGPGAIPAQSLVHAHPHRDHAAKLHTGTAKLVQTLQKCCLSELITLEIYTNSSSQDKNIANNCLNTYLSLCALMWM